MNQKQFDVLVSCKLFENDKISQRKIAERCAISLGSVNKLLADLLELDMIQVDYSLTPKGDAFLESNKVQRAIIIAAGFGERLMPLTLNTAKPLLRIRNERIIDTIIDAILKQGIEEIYIVRGHLKAQFDVLLEKYPMIKFIENNLYNESKNIHSIYLAKELLAGAYIFESDLLIHNLDMISPYQLNSSYYGKKKDVTNDWCFSVKSGIITDLNIGGKNVYEMVGISYWTPKDGKQLALDVEQIAHSPGGLELFWDEIPLKLMKQHYMVHINPCQDSDITEINTYSQIKAMDEIYQG